ncbi:MAG: hypothetical protein E5X11_15470, partial [Mesorhizobium sp.]
LPDAHTTVAPTHWSFGQLASLVGAPATYLRQLPAALAGINLHMMELEKLVAAGGMPMRSMTRTEFEAYEKRVEAVLATVEAAIESVEKKDFDEIAATAREVVEIRREYLELSERQAQAERLEAAPQEGQGERDAPRPPQDGSSSRWRSGPVLTAQ